MSPKAGTLFTTTFPCHNCAKHIVAAGVERVVFVEPYTKSRVRELFDDSIDLEGGASRKVKFEPFMGLGPRRFVDLSSPSQGGREGGVLEPLHRDTSGTDAGEFVCGAGETGGQESQAPRA